MSAPTEVAGLRVSHLPYDTWRNMIYRHRVCNGSAFVVYGVLPHASCVEVLVPKDEVSTMGPWIEASTSSADDSVPEEITRRPFDDMSDIVTLRMNDQSVIYTRQGSGAAYPRPKNCAAAKRAPDGRAADIVNILLVCAPQEVLEAMRADDIMHENVIEVGNANLAAGFSACMENAA